MQKNFLYKKSLIIFLISLIFCSSIFFVPTKKAEAVWGVEDIVFDPQNWVENMWSAFTEGEGWFKEYVLDPIAWIAAKALIREITDSLVEWINNGFEGSPTFISPETYFRDLAQQATGVFIHQLGAEDLLCSPFRLPILASLEFAYSRPSMARFQCTLDVAAENWQKNWDDFQADYLNGGVERFLSISTNAQNNPYGAYLLALDEAESRRADVQEKGKLEVSWGSGFVSMKECQGGKSKEDFCTEKCSGDGYNVDCYNSCISSNWSSSELCQLSGGKEQTTTPGKIIEERLSKALGMDLEVLGLADEISEILSALVNQLLSSDGGLLSHTKGSTYKEPNINFSGQTKKTTLTLMDKSISNEIDYRNEKQKSLNAYNQAISKVNELIDCYRSQGGMDDVINSKLIPLINALEVPKQDFETDVQNANDLISQLNDLKNKIKNTDDSVELIDLINEYNDLRPLLHDPTDIINATDEYNNVVKPAISNIINGAGGIQELLDQCLAGF